MNCKKLRELALTDYLDGQASPDICRQIEEHLAKCPDCQQVVTDVKESVSLPLQQAQEIQPPKRVWTQIQERIQREAPSSPATDRTGIFDFLRSLPYLKRSLILIPALTVILFAVLLPLRQIGLNHQTAGVYLIEELGALQSADDWKAEFGIESFGSVIEEVFM